MVEFVDAGNQGSGALKSRRKLHSISSASAIVNTLIGSSTITFLFLQLLPCSQALSDSFVKLVRSCTLIYLYRKVLIILLCFSISRSNKKVACRVYRKARTLPLPLQNTTSPIGRSAGQEDLMNGSCSIHSAIASRFLRQHGYQHPQATFDVHTKCHKFSASKPQQ